MTSAQALRRQPPAEPSPDGIGGVPRPLLRAVVPALGGYLAVRVVGLLFLLAYGHARHVSTRTRLGTFADAGWYVRIVETGYSVSNGLIGHHGIPYSPRAFFPLFPALADPFHHYLQLTPGDSLLVVASVAGPVAAAGIYACAARCHGHRTGVVAAVLWGVLPLAAIENMAYSEALFTAFAAWSLYAALTRRWIWGGLLAVAAGLTRPTAMALTAALGVAALVEFRRWRREDADTPMPWRPLAGTVLSLLGWAGYMLWTGLAVGSLGGYFHIQAAWGSGFDGGVSAVACLVGLVLVHRSWEGLVMGVSTIGYLWLFRDSLRRGQPLLLLVFSAALLVLDLGNSSAVPPLARFLLPAFPLLFPAAQRLAELPSSRKLAVLLAVGALLSGAYGIVVVFVGGAPA